LPAFAFIELKDDVGSVDNVRLIVRRPRLVIAGKVLDRAGGPMPDVRVACLRQSDGTAAPFSSWLDVPLTVTDQTGAFELRRLPEGSYTVRAVAGNGDEARVPNVAAGETKLIFRLEGAGRVHGKLVGFRTLIDVMAIGARPPTSVAHGTVDGDHYRIDGLPAGRYEIIFSCLPCRTLGVTSRA
jgi:hypothetical protein